MKYFAEFALIAVTVMIVLILIPRPDPGPDPERLEELRTLGTYIGNSCDDYSDDTAMAICARYCYYSYKSSDYQTACALGVYDTLLERRHAEEAEEQTN
jgi:hypothetical protein